MLKDFTVTGLTHSVKCKVRIITFSFLCTASHYVMPRCALYNPPYFCHRLPRIISRLSPSKVCDEFGRLPQLSYVSHLFALLKESFRNTLWNTIASLTGFSFLNFVFYSNTLKFEVLMAVNMPVMIFWGVFPCDLVAFTGVCTSR